MLITKEKMTWPHSAGTAIATHSGSSVSTPEGVAGALESVLKGGGCRSPLVLSLAPPLLLLSSAFGGIIIKCCAANKGFIINGFQFCRTEQYSVTTWYPACNRGSVPQDPVTQSQPGLFVVLPGV